MRRWTRRIVIGLGITLAAVGGLAVALLLWSGQQSAQLVQSGDDAAQAVQSCAYMTLVAPTNPLIVTGTGPTCATLESGLAHDGYFWQAFTGNTADDTATCSLSSGNSTMTIYVGGSEAASLALQTCSSEEANGWTTS